MMGKNSQYPNPLLEEGRNDYIESCSFETLITYEEIVVSREYIEIPVSYRLFCNGLEKLIKMGEAEVLLAVKCTSTSFSRIIKFDRKSNFLLAKIPKFDVIDKISLRGLIVAAKEINKFSCPGEFNDLFFKNATFDIRKGDLLACENFRDLFIDDSELEKPITSIFTIKSKENQEEDILTYYDEEKIIIYLSKRLYDLYCNQIYINNGSFRRYVTAVIVYPVLIEALSVMANNNSEESTKDYSDKRWFRAIEKRAKKINIDLEGDGFSCVSNANKLLGGIVFDGLNSFKETNDEMNTGETIVEGGVD